MRIAKYQKRVLSQGLLLLLMVFSCSLLQAQTAILLGNDSDFFADPLAEASNSTRHWFSDSATLSEALANEHWQTYQHSKQQTMSLGINSKLGSVQWLKFAIHHTGAQRDTWIIDIHSRFAEALSVWLVEADGRSHQLIDYGLHSAFNHKPLTSLFPAAKLELEPKINYDVYVAHSNSSIISPPIRIATPDKFHSVYQSYAYWRGLFYGVVICVLILALITSPFVGRNVSMAFCVFLVTCIVYGMSLDGSLFQYVFSNSQHRTYILHRALPYACIAFLLICMQAIYSTRDRLSKPLSYFLVLSVVVQLVAFFFYLTAELPADTNPPVANWVVIFGLSSALIVALTAGLKRKTGAIPILVGVLLGLTILYFAGAQYPHDITGFRYVVFVSAACLAMAMVANALQIKRERDQAVTSELQLTKEKLQLSEILKSSRADYDRIRLISAKREHTLSTISHDLAQPLGTLRASIRSLRDDKESALHDIEQAFDYLERLARSNINDNSKETEAPSTVETFRNTVITDNLQPMFGAEANAKGLSLQMSIAPMDVTAHPIKLMRLVSNLISNSIKYTEQGQVSLAWQPTDTGFEIVVSDTGVGMNADEVERYQSAYEKSDQSQGDGLGLYIVRSLCDELGYKLVVESVVGEGTRIVVSG